MPLPQGFIATRYSLPRIASWPRPIFFVFRKRVAHDAEGVLGQLVGGHDEIGRVEVDRRDLALADELHEVEGLPGLELHRVELLVVEEDVVALLVLVALQDLVLVDRADAVDHLLVVDAACRSARGSGGRRSSRVVLVAVKSSTGMETSESRIWPFQMGRGMKLLGTWADFGV